MGFRSVGSLWGMWDLHFHTPSSFDYLAKATTDQQIISGLKSSGIVAVAITDHHKIDVERIRNLQTLAGEEMTVFPGIELRSELGGKESVHLIGIFSERQDAEYLWNKLQGPLNITAAEVAAKGDEHVYVKFEDAAALIHELGGVVSVHAGRKTNSIENIGNDHPYKRAFKADLAKAHIDLFEIGKLSDAADYENIVFPSIGVVKPIVACSDNHDVSDYKLRVPCWIKGDPAFESFQQIKSDPSDRVFLGDLPPSVERVRKNTTKYFTSILFKKVPGAALKEDWFSGKVFLNTELIAIIGNKGMGKTALAESIGLLGNTAQHRAFSFLHPSKFKQPRENKASQFEATLEWQDGRVVTKKLSDEISPEAVEAISYIPQHYIERICNELQTTNSNFEAELKAVIFSHVNEAEKLGTSTLDVLISFLTEQTYLRMGQIRDELRGINKEIVELQHLSSETTKLTLTGLFDEKMRELQAHDNSKPVVKKAPDEDSAQQEEMKAISEAIRAKRDARIQLQSDLGEQESRNRVGQLRKAVAERLLGRLRNFRMQYDRFLAEAEPDCVELGLKPADLVKVEINSAIPSTIVTEAQASTSKAETEKTRISGEIEAVDKTLAEFSSRLDAPNAEYQAYLRNLQEWQDRRDQILGSDQVSGSINYLQAQIASLDSIPGLLKAKRISREDRVREIYRELQDLIKTYKGLYDPVQKFIENHQLMSGKYGFAFEALIANADLGDRLFQHISQSRRGTFNGAEEGKKRLSTMIETADFDSEEGLIIFVNTLLGALTHDKRETPSRPIAVSDQLKKESSELDVLNAIFSIEWLIPRYSLKWSGKNLEQLSPGERGALLLIFYLLIDRRDLPLIIDQPEENLDNQTVFELLVPCIKEARKRRQVVLVTHNPNLAVVCDADQIIHCSIDKAAGNKATYLTGAIENPALNRYTVDVLEGTKPAFVQRDSKYQT
jgi:ABC-type lipoprotein export system ATPase subunit